MSNELTFDLKLDHKRTKRLVESCIGADLPIMIHGAPGIGKSDLIKQIAKEQNRELIDIRLPLYEAVDIKGYPYLDEGTQTKDGLTTSGTKKMKFAISEVFPTDPNSNAILFFDEISGAMPTTLLAMYQLFLDRKIGDYTLPKGVSMVAAGNREQDGAVVFPMPKPLENRMAHVELETNFDGWLEWALQNDINRDIIGFLLKNKSKLMEFDTDSGSKTSSRAFPTPRSWAMASKLIEQNLDDEEIMRLQVSSVVGEGAAGLFMAMRKTIHLLPDAKDVINGKKIKLKADLGQALYHLLIINVLQTLREELALNGITDGDQKVGNSKWNQYVENFFDFMLKNDDKIEPEFAAMVLNVAYNTYNLPLKMEAEGGKINEYITRYYKVLKTIPNWN